MLLVRSICTRVSGRAPFLLLPLKVFAGGGSSMALLSKLRRERGRGRGEWMGRRGQRKRQVASFSSRSLPSSPGGSSGRGRKGPREGSDTCQSTPPSGGRALRGSRRGLAPLPRACAARM